jgi:hypothetical protein
VIRANFPYNPLTMLFNFFKAMARSGQWLGLGALLAALPFSATASSVTVDFDISLGAQTGSGNFTYDPSLVLSDSYGNYVNASNNGLQAFNLSYDSENYSITNALDAPTLPSVFLPGNAFPPAAPAGDYGFLAIWVVPGSVSGGEESLIGVGRGEQAFLLTNVVASTISFTGSGSSTTFDVCPIVDNVKSCPDLGVTVGTITNESVAPEPSLLTLTGLGLTGLWFARRRKAVQ